MRGPVRQRGMTLIGWLLTLVLVGFAGVVAIRLVPVYLDAYTVRSVLDQLESEARTDSMDRREVREAFRRRLDINDVETVSASDLKFTDVAGGVQVTIDYEIRVPLIGNLDAVAKFHEEATLRR